MTVQSEITAALEAAFQPRELSVENESFRHSVPPDSETHFKVVLVTEQFSGERSVKRHQRVYGVLAEWLAGPIHALALHTYTPEEWAETVAAPDSPDCRGGTRQVMSQESQSDQVVAALYRFVALDDFADLKPPLLAVCAEAGVKGTLLLAREGINGTIAGSRSGVDTVIAWLRQDPRLHALDWKESYHVAAPFHRMKVKLKREIVTMGLDDVDPTACVGRYATPSEWNALIDDPECLVIDTRNDYEVAIGSFLGAVNPGTQSFRDFPEWVQNNLDPVRHTKVAMFCTGGIRCEKSTSYLVSQGFEDVWHLQGGILKYLEDVPESESRWEGECFVFDSRVAVNHRLEKGSFDQCYACRHPITEADKASVHYEKGVSCPRCYGDLTATRQARFQERQKQVELAATRGEQHIGGPPPARQTRGESAQLAQSTDE